LFGRAPHIRRQVEAAQAPRVRGWRAGGKKRRQTHLRMHSSNKVKQRISFLCIDKTNFFIHVVFSQIYTFFLLDFVKSKTYTLSLLETIHRGAMTHSQRTKPNRTKSKPPKTDQSLQGAPEGFQLTPFDESFRNDPYAVYKTLREAAPIHYGGVSQYGKAWAISEHEAALRVLQMKETCVDALKIGLAIDPRSENPIAPRDPDLIGLDDPDHKRLRRLVQKAFTPKAVEAFRPRINSIVDNILADLGTRHEFDLVTDFAKPIPTMAIAEMLGVDPQDHGDFKRWTDTLVKQGYPMPTKEQWEEIAQADASLRAFFEGIITERRVEPRDDLITALIKAKDEDDRLSEAEIVGMCTLLIGAGNVTTTDLIGNGILALLQHPREMTKLRANPDLIENAVEEMLRFDSSVLFVNRFATSDFELGDRSIKSGDPLNVLLAAANHDPNLCDDPDAFDIARDDVDHLAFGRGIHICLGAPLARLETQIAIAKLLEAFPNLSLAEENVKRKKMILFRGCKSLAVRVRP
jgi:hypothetical protein